MTCISIKDMTSENILNDDKLTNLDGVWPWECVPNLTGGKGVQRT